VIRREGPEPRARRGVGLGAGRSKFMPWRNSLNARTRSQSDFARAWLARKGVRPVDSATWSGPDPWGGQVRTSNDVSHAWTRHALADPELDQVNQLLLALGLLELLDDYWVACEIGWRMRNTQDPTLVATFWSTYRRHLESPVAPEAVRYSLWVDWFEDPSTAKVAFAETLGNDVRRLGACGRLEELTGGPLFRRAERVLQDSGPVPWGIKHGLYRDVVQLEALHTALFRGILASYQDAHGDLEPASALAILNQLRLPDNTPDLASLKAVLAAGADNHHRNPNVWTAAANREARRRGDVTPHWAA
jgi:hypothetical protein